MKQQVQFKKNYKIFKYIFILMLLIVMPQVVAMQLLEYVDWNARLFNAETAGEYLQNRKFKELKAYLDTSSKQQDALDWMKEAVQGGSGLVLYSLIRAKSVNQELRKRYILTGKNKSLQNYDKQCVQLLLIVLYQSIWYAYLKNLPGYPDRMLKIFQTKINTWLTNYFDGSVGLFSLSQYIDEVFEWFTTYHSTNKWVCDDCPEKRSLLMQNSFWVTHCSITGGTGGLAISENSLQEERVCDEYITFLEKRYAAIKDAILCGMKEIVQRMKVKNLRSFIRSDNRLKSSWISALLKKLPKIRDIHAFVSVGRYNNPNVIINASERDDENSDYDSIDFDSLPEISTDMNSLGANQSVGFFKLKKSQGSVILSSVGLIASDICGFAESLYRVTDEKHAIGWFDESFEQFLNTAQPIHLFFAIRYIKTHWKENYLRDFIKFKHWAEHVMFFTYRVALDCIMTYALTDNEAALTKFMDVFCKKIWDDYFNASSRTRQKLIGMPYQEIRNLVINKVNQLHISACKAAVKERRIFPSCIWVSNVGWASSWGTGSWVLQFNNPEEQVKKLYQTACNQYNRELLRSKVLEYLKMIFEEYTTFEGFFDAPDPLKVGYLKKRVETWREESKIKK